MKSTIFCLTESQAIQMSASASRIGGHRITVQEVLEWLSSGASQQQIIEDYPQLEQRDFLAVYAYSADLAAARTGSNG